MKVNKDILNLYIQNGLNILFPIFLIYYIIPIIGKFNYGGVVYFYAITSILALLTDFGFETIGVRLVSKFNKSQIQEKILINITVVKLSIICLFGFIGFFFFNFNVIYVYSLWIPLYSALIPKWYYIGKSSFTDLSKYTLFHKGLIILFLFFLIKNEEDFYILPLISLFSTLVISFFSLRQNNVFKNIHLINIKFMAYLVKSSLRFFSAELIIQMIKTSPKLILGNLNLFDFVTYFDIAEKLTNMLKIPNQIITKYLLPKLSYSFNFSLIKSHFKKSLIFNLVTILIFNLLLEIVLQTFRINVTKELIFSTRILSFNVIIILFNNILGQQILIPLNQVKSFFKAVLVGSFAYLLIISLLLFSYLNVITPTTLSILLLFTEVIILITQFILISKNEDIKNRLFSRSSL